MLPLRLQNEEKLIRYQRLQSNLYVVFVSCFFLKITAKHNKIKTKALHFSVSLLIEEKEIPKKIVCKLCNSVLCGFYVQNTYSKININ